jgi:hypothetical protein
LAWAATILLSAFLLKIAQGNHVISGDTASRGVLVVIGLTLAVYANFMTKQPTKAGPTEQGGRVQAALRLSAWLFCMAALVYAAASAFAPHPLDEILSMGAVGTATLVSAGNFVRMCARRA